LLPALAAPLAGLAEALKRGAAREAADRGALSTRTQPRLRVPALGTAGWHDPVAAVVS
jgi:hypothetical protein